MTGSDAIEGYLAAVEGYLPGPAGVRRGVLDELRDGLLEAADQYDHPDPRTRADAAIAQFGDASTVGGAIADELRLQLARRQATTVFLLLTLAGLGWQLYRSFVGFPASTIPDDASAPLFLAAVDTIRIAPAVAQVAALLLIAATSVRHRAPAAARTALVTVSVTALSISILAAITAAVTVGRPHGGVVLLAGVSTAALLSATLLLTRRAYGYLQGTADHPPAGIARRL